MFPTILILYFITPARHADAGLQVQGHIEMGDSIAKLFNEVVEQFQQSAPALQKNATNIKNHRDMRFDKLRLSEQFMKPNPAWLTNTNLQDLLHIAKNQEKTTGIQYTTPSEEVGYTSELTLLEKMMRNPFPTIVHLYGHHRIDDDYNKGPRNNVNT